MSWRLLTIVFLVLLPSVAEAQALAWDEDYRRVGWEEVAVIGASAAALVVLDTTVDQPAESRWVGPFLIDDQVRNGLLADEENVEAAAAISDILFVGLMGWTVAIDSIGIAGLSRDQWDSARQSSTIAVQSVALNTLVTIGLKYAIGRRRPGFGRCYSDPFADETCAKRPNVSFPSGHTSTAFTGAGLICVTHENVPYYGGGIGDRIACYVALAAATATGLLRITSNNHYLSDVLAGAAIGLSIGYLLPKFIYFSDTEESTEAVTAPLEGPPPPTIQFGGTF